MNRRDIKFAPKDRGLRDDVRRLGALVGEVIREQNGEALFRRVEGIRRAAIARREGKPRAGERLLRQTRDLPAGVAGELVRAFSTYFQAVNLAERVHRIRRRRDYERRGSGPQPEGLEDSLRQLKLLGVGAAELRGLLERLVIEPVFTAHPTEATRRTLLEKQQRMARSLIARLDPKRTPREEAAALARIRIDLTAGWQTEEHPDARMTVANEREHVLFYLTDVLYRTLPQFYETLEEALETQFDLRMTAPVCIRFGSWVGGDMDGNPNVTAETVRETLAEHREMILARYAAELHTLHRSLSQSRSRVAVSGAVEARLKDYARAHPRTAEGIPPRHRDMPYRVLLSFMRERLRATREDSAGAYARAEELLEDLELIADSLRAHKGAHAGLFAVRRLQRRVATFGFHLATLDVRQDSLVHRRAVGELLDEAGWEEAAPEARAARLRRALEGNEAPRARGGEEARATLAVFGAIAEGRRRYGARAVGPYIISMARHAEDVLAVLLLARWGGLEEDGTVPLDVAPLFETVDDLRQAAATMRGLFADRHYRAHLQRRGEAQILMVGYSDSNKDGGLAASRWAVQRAQEELVRAGDEAGVALTIFHGRGGTTSRGGGRTHRAVLAAPPGAVRGRLRLTEQGEIINAKYGLRAIALRTLEQMSGAVLLATHAERDAGELPREWRAAADTLAAESRRAFRALVYDSPDFFDFFRQATPIDVIERMRIGSRPPSRRARTGIENLRAIPWVFSWTQTRSILTGWYGLGGGLEAVRARHGEGRLRDMLDWPFFANLIDDAEMVLAKADLDIAARYTALAEDRLQPLFENIRDEYERTVGLVRELRGAGELLAHDPVLSRSIRLRNPYVDPMNLLQVDLLARWRAGDREDEELLDALFATVNGIALGLQNTG